MAQATIIDKSVDKNGWRTTTIGLDGPLSTPKKIYAICVKDDPGHLTLSKLYKIDITDGLACVKDDNDESSVYPFDEFFVQITLSRATKSRIAAALSI